MPDRDPSVSPADTIRRARDHIDLFAQYVDTDQAVTDLGALADLAAALLAVGERDKAALRLLREEIRIREESQIPVIPLGAQRRLETLEAERERARRQIAQLTERGELLEVLGEQAVGTIEFLHGCLTDPGYMYAYPEQTEQRLAELRRFLPEREMCVHSKFVPDCQGCIDGKRAREVMGRARAVLAGEEDARHTEYLLTETPAAGEEEAPAMSAMPEVPTHEIRYMRRVTEGSVRAECSCGWIGPKRTEYGGMAPQDGHDHVAAAIREWQSQARAAGEGDTANG